MKAKNFIIYTGYVESRSWSCLTLKHKYGFDSIEEALQHLGECIALGLKESREYYRTCESKCCEKERENNDNIYCRRCGKLLENNEINSQDISNCVLDFRIGDNDSIPHEFWEMLDLNNWGFWSDKDQTEFKNVTVLKEYSEIIIGRAAFGRIFKDDDDYPSSKNNIVETMVVPIGMKVFGDDQ